MDLLHRRLGEFLRQRKPDRLRGLLELLVGLLEAVDHLLGHFLDLVVLGFLEDLPGQGNLGLVVERGGQDEQLVGGGLGVGGDLRQQLVDLLLRVGLIALLLLLSGLLLLA